jgi:hypothetical protein
MAWCTPSLAPATAPKKTALASLGIEMPAIPAAPTPCTRTLVAGNVKRLPSDVTNASRAFSAVASGVNVAPTT